MPSNVREGADVATCSPDEGWRMAQCPPEKKRGTARELVANLFDRGGGAPTNPSKQGGPRKRRSQAPVNRQRGAAQALATRLCHEGGAAQALAANPSSREGGPRKRWPQTLGNPKQKNIHTLTYNLHTLALTRPGLLTGEVRDRGH